MHIVATLVARPLLRESIDAARAALPQGATFNWLAEDEACDLRCEGETCQELEAALLAALRGAPVDVFCQPDTSDRRKRLLLADMDSTIITVECIDEMADVLGLKSEVAAITEQAMRGEIEFPEALRARAALLKGLSQDELERVYAERVRLTPGAATLVGTMRAHGAHCALVSGGFTFFTERVAAAAGFHEHHANRLVVQNGQLTGQVETPILDSNSKLERLQQTMKQHGLTPQQTMAVGDGANDVPMLQAAGIGAAFHAKPVAAEAADARITHGDLTALLYLQGYRREDFERG